MGAVVVVRPCHWIGVVPGSTGLARAHRRRHGNGLFGGRWRLPDAIRQPARRGGVPKGTCVRRGRPRSRAAITIAIGQERPAQLLRIYSTTIFNVARYAFLNDALVRPISRSGLPAGGLVTLGVFSRSSRPMGRCRIRSVSDELVDNDHQSDLDLPASARLERQIRWRPRWSPTTSTITILATETVPVAAIRRCAGIREGAVMAEAKNPRRGGSEGSQVVLGGGARRDEGACRRKTGVAREGRWRSGHPRQDAEMVEPDKASPRRSTPSSARRRPSLSARLVRHAGFTRGPARSSASSGCGEVQERYRPWLQRGRQARRRQYLAGRYAVTKLTAADESRSRNGEASGRLSRQFLRLRRGMAVTSQSKPSGAASNNDPLCG